MTWIIGTPTMWGYGVVIGDIQVTIEEIGKPDVYVDCLQKVHMIAPSLLVGFSGRVKTCFAMLHHMQSWLQFEPDQNPEEWGWIPEFVAEHWPVAANHYYWQLPEDDRGPVEMLMMGAHPTLDNGMPGYARVQGYVYRSKNGFAAEEIHASHVTAIGSGNAITEYKRTIQHLDQENIFHPFHQMQVGSPDGFAHALAIQITNSISNTPSFGISPHLHIGICRRRGYRIISNDHDSIASDGSSRTLAMPNVARTWKQYKRILQSKGFSTARQESSAC